MRTVTSIWHSIILAFSTFSRIPVPTIKWNDNSMRYLMATLPLVGVVVGAVLALWCWLCDLLHFGVILRAAGITILPLLISGGIHMDGFCDVTDALASHAPVERRREILKDPHTGAFAIIVTGTYLLAYFALASEIPAKLPGDYPYVLLLCLMPIVSRVMGGAVSLLGTRSTNEGMLSSFQQSAGKTGSIVALGLIFAICAAVMLWAQWIPALAMLLGALAVFALTFPFARHWFGGMSGDIAGFCIQLTEVIMLVCLVVALKVVAL